MKKKYEIDISEKVTINNFNYYLRLRSFNTANPVVLFLHGGCGAADRPFIMKWQSPLAEYATIVSWDQRGAGMAYSRKNAATEILTKELYIDDLHNVVSYLKEKFQKDKIILVGHSFGSQFGVWYAQRYPEDLECYVGIGQVVESVRNEEISFDFTLQEAQRKNDKKAVKRLLEIGPPVNGVYKNDKLLVQRNYLNKFGGVLYGKYANSAINTLPKIPCMFKEYPLGTILNYIKANTYCLSQPLGKEKVNFFKEADSFDIPVYLFMGRSDYNTVYTLAEEWFNIIKAPIKKFFSFEKSGHTPQWEEPEKFNALFIKEVICKNS